MSRHIFHAVIGPSDSVDEFSNRWVLARSIYLPQHFAMVPFTVALFDDIAELMDLSDPDPFVEFERLSATAEIAFRDASQFGRLGYIETSYLGGCRTQSAIAWNRGEILLGALRSETNWNSEGYEEISASKSAIDQVLSVLGVWTNRNKSEFDMLGLNNFRDTELAAGE